MKTCFYPLIAVLLIACSQKQGPQETSTGNDTRTDSTISSPDGVPEKAIVVAPTDSSFNSFLTLFQTPETRLPDWAIEMHLKSDPVGHATVDRILSRDPFILVSYVQFMPVGPGTDDFHVASFTKEGEKISDVKLGSSYSSSGPDGGGQQYRNEYYDDEHKVIAMTNFYTDWNERDQEEFTWEYSSFYLLDNDGKIVNGRKYPEISTGYITKESLSEYSKDELKIMRNEIFASYGYIFKSEPMKSYYAAVRWYSPEVDNVDNMLNLYEKENIKTIKLVEDQK